MSRSRCCALTGWAVAVLLAACSASNEDPGGNGTGGSGAGTTVGGGGSMTSSSGTGGMEACDAIGQEALPEKRDADIIFAIDTSASMAAESWFVREQMNNFSTQIVASGVDVRVVMLAERPILPACVGPMCPPGICVDAPLGSGLCPADDNPPVYVHPPSDVGSTDALSVLVDLFPQYDATLRENTNKVVVIVTDDNASPPNIADAAEFVNTFTALSPVKLSGVTVHAIYCFHDSGPCASKGQVYEDLVNLTGGIHGDLELQDFQPVFDAVATEVIVQAGLPCHYTIPPPPEGQTFDSGLVNVVYTDGDGNEHDILFVDSAAACHPQDGGWYYDDNLSPQSIHLCPASCDIVSVDGAGKIDILFGCETKIAPPA
ncbi:MAG: VWA domain-containing protein [Deltaproteobacteria bacterium]|nr:VWA domain-containing protein [Deltaproteobacteria bacterium]